MKFLVATLLFSALFIKCYCQNENYAIKFSPLTMMDPLSFPSVTVGCEMMLSKRFSIYNEAGIKFRKSEFEGSDTNFVDSYGFKIKIELRRYLLKKYLRKKYQNRNPGSLSGIYYAMNFFYNRDEHNQSLGYYHGRAPAVDNEDNLPDILPNRMKISLNDFGIKKNIYGFNLVTGMQKRLKGNFLIDIYAGIGIRWIKVKFINLKYDKKKDTLYNDSVDLTMEDIKLQRDLKSDMVSGNFTGGIRFCYRF